MSKEAKLSIATERSAKMNRETGKIGLDMSRKNCIDRYNVTIKTSMKARLAHCTCTFRLQNDLYFVKL